MLQRHISGLPVVDQKGRVVGIVTEGDFLRRAETGTQRRRPRWLEYLIGPGRLADEYTRSHGRKVSEIMTADPLTVTEETSLDEVVRLMEKCQIKRLPVIREQQVVGIVSRANLVHALASVARQIKPTSASDQAIRDRILRSSRRNYPAYWYVSRQAAGVESIDFLTGGASWRFLDPVSGCDPCMG
jgi:predicted transcriptional regulator